MAVTKERERELMLAINDIYTALSPENISWDGMANNAEVKAASTKLFAELAVLEKELGKTVDEHEAYQWLIDNLD